MQYMKLDAADRHALLADLATMPRELGELFAGLSDQQAVQAGPAELFSPVEQAWHLADLEREGFGVRIDRLLQEHEPQLPDFDGTAVALARNYRARSLADGLRAFDDARRENLAKLQRIADSDWERSGTQEGIGKVSLCDMPVFLRQHDAAHREEVRRWFQGLANSAAHQ
jgi:hypothetical protein